MIAHIEDHGGANHLLVWIPYDGDLLDDLKATIPSYGRKWIPTMKAWWIKGEYRGRLYSLLARYGIQLYRTQPADKDTPEPATKPRSRYEDSYSMLYLQSSAPVEVVDAAYRALAKLYHPDHRSSAEKDWGEAQMKRLNLAMEQIRMEQIRMRAAR